MREMYLQIYTHIPQTLAPYIFHLLSHIRASHLQHIKAHACTYTYNLAVYMHDYSSAKTAPEGVSGDQDGGVVGDKSAEDDALAAEETVVLLVQV